jgi:hypothetical protein
MQASSLIIHQQHPQTKTKETHFTHKQKVHLSRKNCANCLVARLFSFRIPTGFTLLLLLLLPSDNFELVELLLLLLLLLLLDPMSIVRAITALLLPMLLSTSPPPSPPAALIPPTTSTQPAKPDHKLKFVALLFVALLLAPKTTTAPLLSPPR